MKGRSGISPGMPLLRFSSTATPAGEKGALRNGKRVEFPFEFVSSAIPGGYRATFRIPEAREYVGLDLIVTRGDGGKERIPGVEGRSFRERFHYPLFRLAENSRLENGSFERCNTLSMPKHWLYDIRYGTAFRCVPEAGYAGRGMAVVVEREQKVPVLVMQRVEFPAGRFRRATLSFLAKLDEVKSPKEGKGKFGMQVPVRHEASRRKARSKEPENRTSPAHRSGRSISSRSRCETTRTFWKSGLGLGPETTGKLCIDNVSSGAGIGLSREKGAHLMKLWSVVSACVAACILNAADDLRIDLLAECDLACNAVSEGVDRCPGALAENASAPAAGGHRTGRGGVGRRTR